jgi:competence protein ComEA
MPDLTPRQLALSALALLGLVVLGAWYLGRGEAPGGEPVGAPPALEMREPGEGGELLVHVAGAVRRPGVYRMRPGARVDDAVEQAGGPRRRADLSALNLAAEVQDGRQVVVPVRQPAGVSRAGAAAPPPGVPLNLNTATVEQLDELDGIGPATAQQIVDFRESRGGFGSIEELDQVPGIGEARMATLREKVRL